MAAHESDRSDGSDKDKSDDSEVDMLTDAPTPMAGAAFDSLADAAVPLEPLPGRVELTLLHGENLDFTIAPDEHPTLDEDGEVVPVRIADLYLNLWMGNGESIDSGRIAVTSEVMKRAGSSPVWKDTVLKFDIPDPTTLLPATWQQRVAAEGRAVLKTAPMLLRWDLMQSRLSGERLLGQGELDIASVYKCFGSNARDAELLTYYLTPEQRAQRKAYHKSVAYGTGDVQSLSPIAMEGQFMGKISASLRFLPLQSGLLTVTLLKAEDLPNTDAFSKQDPYLKWKLHDRELRSATAISGGTQPYFREEQLTIFVGGSDWLHTSAVEIWDEDSTQQDTLMAVGSIDVLRFTEGFGSQQREIPLHLPGKRAAGGTVHVVSRFYPAGKLNLEIVGARGLLQPEHVVGTLRPRVSISVAQQLHDEEFDSGIGSGMEPTFESKRSMLLVSAAVMKMEVWHIDEQAQSPDDNTLLGSCSVPLDKVYQLGIQDTWVVLKARAGHGRTQQAGQVQLRMDFMAPEGIRYPQLAPGGGTTHSHTERKYRPGVVLPRFMWLPPEAKDSMPDQLPDGSEVDNYTDMEVREAFDFIDLDHNDCIGPAEVRHILTCMGELITDAEIDMMIEMLDVDGSSMISYPEFYAMAKHPNPALLDLSQPVPEVLLPFELRGKHAGRAGMVKPDGPPVATPHRLPGPPPAALSKPAGSAILSARGPGTARKPPSARGMPPSARGSPSARAGMISARGLASARGSHVPPPPGSAASSTYGAQQQQPSARRVRGRAQGANSVTPAAGMARPGGGVRGRGSPGHAGGTQPTDPASARAAAIARNRQGMQQAIAAAAAANPAMARLASSRQGTARSLQPA